MSLDALLSCIPQIECLVWSTPAIENSEPNFRKGSTPATENYEANLRKGWTAEVGAQPAI